MHCYLVHGYNVSDGGKNTTDKLAPYLSANGWNVRQFDYGWTGLLRAWLGNNGRARTLASISVPGDIAVGHSNGCAIIHRATHLGAQFKTVVYVNPALDVDVAPGPNVENCVVFHSPDDKAVLAAKFIPLVLWGAQGRYGYQGNDERVMSINLLDRFGGPMGHSGAFSDKHLRAFGLEVAQQVGAANQ